MRTICLALAWGAVLSAATSPDITIEIKDYVSMPMTGAVDGAGQVMSLLARVNFLREEPVADPLKTLHL